MIEVANLTKRYAGHTAVSDISFSVGRGEIVGLLGPNGAGKSTTMRILSCFLPATSGTVRVAGYDVFRESCEVRRRIGFMPENNPLHMDLRVREYLKFRARLKGLGWRRSRERVDVVMQQCGLTDVSRKIIGQLSKGYKQRVGLADALVHEPDLIILDEPTIGLDPHQILMIRDLIAGLRGRMSVILSSHILPEIEMSCDQVLIINQGRIVASGAPAALRREFLGPVEYRLEAAGDPAVLMAALTDLSGAARLAPLEERPAGDFTAYRVSGLDEAAAERALGALVAGGARVRAFSRIEASLEDVFLAATRRSWDVTLDGKKRPAKPGEETK